MKTTVYPVFNLLILLIFTGCANDRQVAPDFIQYLTFYASFDHGFEADYAAGDPVLYSAPSLDRAAEDQIPYQPDEQQPFADILENEGRYGNALRISLPYEPILFYRGKDNMPYRSSNWNGTISFWMNMDDKELAPGFSDPIQITSRGWNDGALFVDFTDEDPRIFRFAIFPDREVWDPEMRDWEDVPAGERPMVDLPDHPFTEDQWHHVAFTFSSFNTGQPDGIVNCYLNGEHVGELSGRDKTFTWDPERVAIWLGYNFRGLLDEIAIFDRALSADEVQTLFELDNGISSIK